MVDARETKQNPRRSVIARTCPCPQMAVQSTESVEHAFFSRHRNDLRTEPDLSERMSSRTSKRTRGSRSASIVRPESWQDHCHDPGGTIVQTRESVSSKDAVLSAGSWRLDGNCGAPCRGGRAPPADRRAHRCASRRHHPSLIKQAHARAGDGVCGRAPAEIPGQNLSRCGEATRGKVSSCVIRGHDAYSIHHAFK